MDFSLTHLIVVPTTNTLPTTGSTQDLTAGQVGVYRPDYTPATVGNAAAAAYLYIAQGRAEKSLPTLRSDKINPDKVIYWTKVTGSNTYSNQITEVSDFHVKCDEDVSLTIRLDSYYIRAAFYNGLTRSLVVKAPCCECEGDDPCTDVDAEGIVDLLIAKANEDFSSGRESTNLAQFLIFEKVGTGASTVLRITAKDNTSYTPLVGDIATNPYQFDRLSFKTFVRTGPDTMSDFEVDDRCEDVATIEVKQRATYVRLTATEVAQLEKDYYSYKVSSFKQLYRNPGYNPLFESYVEDGVVYDQYMIQFYQHDQIKSWNEEDTQDERVLLYIPNDDNTNLVAILTAAFGTPTNESGNVVTTSSTTSTTTTSTTTTTTLIP